MFSNARRRLRRDHGAGGLEVATRTRRHTKIDLFIWAWDYSGMEMERVEGGKLDVIVVSTVPRNWGLFVNGRRTCGLMVSLF